MLVLISYVGGDVVQSLDGSKYPVVETSPLVVSPADEPPDPGGEDVDVV